MKPKRFSIEDLFHITEIEKHAIGVQFIPTSPSYNKYEDGVTVLHIHDVELEYILNNIRTEQFTYGIIEATGYDNTPPPTSDPILLKFDTKDIHHTETVRR